jgi:hypothetical protein
MRGARWANALDHAERSMAGAADWVALLHDRWLMVHACVSNEPPRGSRVQVDGQ